MKLPTQAAIGSAIRTAMAAPTRRDNSLLFCFKLILRYLNVFSENFTNHSNSDRKRKRWRWYR